jgi:hypothetical protein
MKIERNAVVPKFEPVKLILESQAELDLIVSLIGATNRATESEFGITNHDALYQTWSKLDDLSSSTRKRLNSVTIDTI